MTHIDFTEPETQEWKDWRTLCDRVQRDHNKAIELGRSSKVKGRVYKGQKNVYINLDGPFHGKCAYCEQKISGDQYIDIEHFRPKNGVNDEQTGEPITIEVGGSIKRHPGYYWLAYDWKNLLPSCILCNRPPSRKNLFFPVEGFRAVRPGEEEQESPLLIHPVFDKPEEHLEMDALGVFTSKSDRGETCIRIFGLNLRGLPDERKKVYENVRQKMGLLCLDAAAGRNAVDILEQLTATKKGLESFTFAARKAIFDSEKDCSIKLETLTARDTDYV